MNFMKKIVLLGSILGLLIVIFVIGILTSPRARNLRNFVPSLITDVRSSDVAHVLIQGLNEQVTELEYDQDNELWGVILENEWRPGQMLRIGSFLDTILELRQERQVTKATDAQAVSDFGFSEEAEDIISIVMQNGDGDNIVELEFGGNSSERNWRYVRFIGDSTIYLTSDAVNFYLREDLSYWSELAMLPDDLEDEDIISFRIAGTVHVNVPVDDAQAQSDGQQTAPQEPLKVPQSVNYTLIHVEDTEGARWEVSNNSNVELDQAKVERLISQTVGMEASEFAPRSRRLESGLDEPSLTIQIETSDTRRYELQVGFSDPRDPDLWYAHLVGPELPTGANGDPYLYLVGEWTLMQIGMPLDQLLVSAENG